MILNCGAVGRLGTCNRGAKWKVFMALGQSLTVDFGTLASFPISLLPGCKGHRGKVNGIKTRSRAWFDSNKVISRSWDGHKGSVKCKADRPRERLLW